MSNQNNPLEEPESVPVNNTDDNQPLYSATIESVDLPAQPDAALPSLTTNQNEPPMEIHHHGHVHEKKKWKEYLFQFLMLFLAVFCGFMAEYQLEHKIEKDREKQFMQTMAEDLRADTASLNRLIRTRKTRIRELIPCFI